MKRKIITYSLFESNVDDTKDITEDRIPETESTKNNKNTSDEKPSEEKTPSEEKEKVDIIEEKISYFDDFVFEGDGGVAYATAGNSAGMGSITAPQPSATPGDVAGSSIGSGDLPAYDKGYTFENEPFKKKKYKRNKKYSTKRHATKLERMSGINTNKEEMYVTKFSNWVNM